MRSLTEELYQAGVRQLRQEQSSQTIQWVDTQTGESGLIKRRLPPAQGRLFEVSIIVGVLATSQEEAERISVTEAVNVPAKLAKYSPV